MGETFAISQSSGSSPGSEDYWKICCRSGATCSVHVLKIVAVIQSGPDVFCGIVSFKSFTIPPVETWIGSTDLVGDLFNVVPYNDHINEDQIWRFGVRIMCNG